MNAGLLFLPGVVIVGFLLLFATTALERLIASPTVRVLPLATDDSRLAPRDPRNKKAGTPWASS